MITGLMAVVTDRAPVYLGRPMGCQRTLKRARPTLFHPPRHVFVNGGVVVVASVRGGF
jgi:hypothetical protein